MNSRVTRPGRNKIIVRILAICLLWVALAFAISCGAYYYYTVQESKSINIGHVTFAVTPKPLQLPSNNPTILPQSDSLVDYLELSVYVDDTVQNVVKMTIRIDSVFVFLTTLNFKHLVSIIPKPTLIYSGRWGTHVTPIPIPAHYNNDLVAEFNMALVDSLSGRVLLTEHMSVPILYHKEKYFIFDLPYD